MAQPFRGVALYDIQNYVLKYGRTHPPGTQRASADVHTRARRGVGKHAPDRLQDGQNPHFGSLSAVTLVPSYLELTRMTWVLERLAQTVPAVRRRRGRRSRPVRLLINVATAARMQPAPRLGETPCRTRHGLRPMRAPWTA